MAQPSTRPVAEDPGDEVITAKLRRPRLVTVTRKIGDAFGTGASAVPRVTTPPPSGVGARGETTARWPPGPPFVSVAPAGAAPATGVRAASARPPDPARTGPTTDSFFDSLEDEDTSDDPQEYLALLGGDHGVPRARVPSHEFRSVCDDPREAFLLSLLDGISTTREIVESSGMDELDALRRLHKLLLRDLLLLEFPERSSSPQPSDRPI